MENRLFNYNTVCFILLLPYIVFSLSICSVHGVCPAVQAGGHLEGLDKLSCAHATGALCHNSCEAHLSLHVNLEM